MKPAPAAIRPNINIVWNKLVCFHVNFIAINTDKSNIITPIIINIQPITGLSVAIKIITPIKNGNIILRCSRGVLKK